MGLSVQMVVHTTSVICPFVTSGKSDVPDQAG
jgi:hypothetical protein